MAMQVFTNEKFGQLRTVEINGVIHFVGKDVAEILGYANPRDALAKHVDEEDKNTVAIRDAIQGNPNMTVINESGLYSLILSSKLPAAKEFKRWVTAEVLPSIRKNGSYSLQNYTPGANAVIDAQKIADEIQKMFDGVQRGIAISQALDIASVMHNAPLQNLKQLIPPATHDVGYLNATQLGDELGVSVKIMNKILFVNGLQMKTDDGYKLTEKGKKFGEMLPYTKNGHSGYQIRWSRSVLGALEL